MGQTYPGNPDSMATGYTDCYLCTNGTMTCSATVFGGRTRLIASHIHIADNGDGATGSGAPVINFCGDNGDGFINDGTDYRSPCSAYDDGHSAYMPTMFGAFVDGTNMGYTLASRIMDIGMNPHKYYFNFHRSPAGLTGRTMGTVPLWACAAGSLPWPELTLTSLQRS